MSSGNGSGLALDPAEQRWVELKWKEIRKSQQEADRANNGWKSLNASINHYLDESGITDIVQRNKIKGESLPLKDALETGKWHSGNASRHLLDLQVFLQAKSLGVRLA